MLSAGLWQVDAYQLHGGIIAMVTHMMIAVSCGSSLLRLFMHRSWWCSPFPHASKSVTTPPWKSPQLPGYSVAIPGYTGKSDSCYSGLYRRERFLQTLAWSIFSKNSARGFSFLRRLRSADSNDMAATCSGLIFSSTFEVSIGTLR